MPRKKKIKRKIPKRCMFPNAWIYKLKGTKTKMFYNSIESNKKTH